MISQQLKRFYLNDISSNTNISQVQLCLIVVLIMLTSQLNTRSHLTNSCSHWRCRTSVGTTIRTLDPGRLVINVFMQLIATLVFPNNFVITQFFICASINYYSLQFGVHFHPYGCQTLLVTLYLFSYYALLYFRTFRNF